MPILFFCGMKTSTKAHLALFTVALFYGANYSIAKDVLNNEYIQPSGFIMLRVFAGAILFTLVDFLFVRKRRVVEAKADERLVFGLISYSDLPRFWLCALTGVAINQMFFFHGLKLTTPINASLILTMVPIIVLILSGWLLKERIGWKKSLGIVLGVSGAIILTLYGKNIAYNLSGALGDFFILVNAVSYGYYLIVVKKLTAKYNPITLAKWIFIFGTVLIFPFGIGDLLTTAWETFPMRIWLATFYVLIFATFGTYMLNIYALSKVNASVVGIYIYLQPFIAATIAIYLGQDELTWIKVISGMLIFTGVYFVSFTKSKKLQKK